MKLFTKTDFGKIYHGDSIEYLTRQPGKNEIILSDPPYGHGKKIIADPGGKWKHLKNDYKSETWNFPLAPVYFEYIRKRPYILSGANYYAGSLGIKVKGIPANGKFDLPGDIVSFLVDNPIGWLIWDKCRPRTLTFSGYEMIYSSLPMESEVIPIQWNGLIQPEPRKQYRVVRFHPAQKPVDLWMAILKKLVPPGTLVIDPFAGSCSLAIACEKMQYPYICIEKDRDYALEGARWVETHCQNRRLF